MTYSYNTKSIQINALLCTIAGTIVFFVLYSLLSLSESPLVTFMSAFFSGLIGLIVSSKWIIGNKWGNKATVFILLAYIARIIVGLYMYLDINPDYFESDGDYVYDRWDYRWTYEFAMRVTDSVLLDHVYLPINIPHMDEDKNANIHTWMGYFMASGNSHNALDLTPFNAFHHALAGFFMIAISLARRYSYHTASLVGIATAWIPWGFSASIMWRDSVGFAWVVLAIMLLTIAKDYSVLIKLMTLVVAMFLGYSDRKIYILIIFVCGVYIYATSKNSELNLFKHINRYSAIKTSSLILLFIILFSLIDRQFFGDGVNFGLDIIYRIYTLPLLIIRGIAGPFPWVNTDIDFIWAHRDAMFDYAFHVFQLAIFIVIASRWEYASNKDDFLFLTAILFWLTGIIATGVHTAYIVIAMPFILPIAFELNKNIGVYIFTSLGLFIVFNVLYLSSGLNGSSVLIGVTGY